jgi:iron complex transport system substrate-binding protein
LPLSQMNAAPQRIVCLCAEAADWFWRIGAWDKIVGVTAYFAQPPSATPKPRVSGFDSVRFDDLRELKPDLVVTFSDVQATITAELIRSGFNVIATNQRTLAETEATMALLARLVGREREAEVALKEFREKLAPVKNGSRRPRVYFEEWNDPLISGITWVSELVERAGGEEIFPELCVNRAASERVVSPEQVLAANPEIIFASWCGKRFDADAMVKRPGWGEIAAVRAGRIYEIAGADILQPGFNLVQGYEQLKSLIHQAA